MTGPVLNLPPNLLHLLMTALDHERDANRILAGRCASELDDHEYHDFLRLMARRDDLLDEFRGKVWALNYGFHKKLERRLRQGRRAAQVKVMAYHHTNRAPQCASTY